MDGAGFSALVERNQEVRGVNEQVESLKPGSAEVLPPHGVSEKPLSANGARLLLFIKFGPSVDHRGVHLSRQITSQASHGRNLLWVRSRVHQGSHGTAILPGLPASAFLNGFIFL